MVYDDSNAAFLKRVEYNKRKKLYLQNKEKFMTKEEAKKIIKLKSRAYFMAGKDNKKKLVNEASSYSLKRWL